MKLAMMNERIRKGIIYLIIFFIFILFIMIASYIYYLYDVYIAATRVTNNHFLMMQDEGYLSENIRKSIINDFSDNIGPRTHIDISGTSERVNEGENIFLQFKFYPHKNKQLLNFAIKRVGIRKYRIK